MGAHEYSSVCPAESSLQIPQSRVGRVLESHLEVSVRARPCWVALPVPRESIMGQETLILEEVRLREVLNARRNRAGWLRGAPRLVYGGVMSLPDRGELLASPHPSYGNRRELCLAIGTIDMDLVQQRGDSTTPDSILPRSGIRRLQPAPSRLGGGIAARLSDRTDHMVSQSSLPPRADNVAELRTRR